MHQEPVGIVKFIRLVTGEDLIAHVFPEEKQFYRIVDPMKILYTIGKNNPNEGYYISLVPWIFHSVCVEQKFDIPARDIMVFGDPTKEMESYYVDILSKKDAIISRAKELHEQAENMIPDDNELQDILESMREALNLNTNVDKKKLN